MTRLFLAASAAALVIVFAAFWLAPGGAIAATCGPASFYAEQHQGRTMANGRPFNMYAMTAASWYYPLGTRVSVMNAATGRQITVTITDRGPARRLHRVIDLSKGAFAKLAPIRNGIIRKVCVSRF